MKYNFDSVIERHNTNSVKWDYAEEFFSLKGLLPMWIADMDYKAPEPIIASLTRIAEHGIFGYTVVPQSYYDALISWMGQQHNWDIQKEWVVLSPGVIPALHMLVKAFTKPGDQVVVQTPVYYPFFNAIKSNGCEILGNPLRLEGDQYVMDLTDLEEKINTRTKMIILCNPHNPISRVWKKNELIDLGELCIKNKILIISDEIHADIVYRGFKHVPFASISEDFSNNSVVCTGASKTFNLPGLQTANIIIPNPEIRERFRNIVNSCGIMSPNTFGIAATEAAYRYGNEWLVQLLEYLQENIAFARDFADRMIPALKIIQPQGTYLLWLDFRGCGISDMILGNFVREHAKVGLEAGTMFGCKENGLERMNIACPRSILSEGLTRIEKAIRLLPHR